MLRVALRKAISSGFSICSADVRNLAQSAAAQRVGRGDSSRHSDHESSTPTESHPGAKYEETKYTGFSVYTDKNGHTLHINFDNIDCSAIDKAVLDALIWNIAETTKREGEQRVCMDNLPESVFINGLSRTMDKLGYGGNFMRYNQGLGLASFEKYDWNKVQPVHNGNGNVYHSCLPNPC